MAVELLIYTSCILLCCNLLYQTLWSALQFLNVLKNSLCLDPTEDNQTNVYICPLIMYYFTLCFDDCRDM